MVNVDVITLSRQLGSGGDRIACEVAERLGWRLVDRDIIERAARASGSPEAALAEIDELGFLGLRPSDRARELYRDSVEMVIEKVAEQGEAVIVGRAGQVVLGGRANVFHIKIVAPAASRIQRVMRWEGVSEAAAVNRIVASDQSRERYLYQAYGVQWLDPLLYDLVINTRSAQLFRAVDLIVSMVLEKA